MSSRNWRFVFLAVFTVIVAALLVARHRELERLRLETERARASSAALAEMQRANAKLAAARVSEQELASLRADHATVASMRNEIAAIERSIEAREQAASLPVRTASAEPTTLLDGPLTAKQWRNAGRATPVATVETMLWAAAHGQSGRLVETLAMSPEARAKAEAIYNSLPPDLRQEMATPERLFGALTAKDVTMQSAEVVAEVPFAQGTMLVLNLQNADNQSRRVQLRLQPQGDHWRIEVPPAAVDRFVAQAREKSPSLQVPPVKVN